MNSMSGEKLKGIPYTGTLPATLTGTKAGYLHSYKIYGNLSQSGTPTPENPIEPSECGERTENLWKFGNVSFNINDGTKSFTFNCPASSMLSFRFSGTKTEAIMIAVYDENNTVHYYTFTNDNSQQIYKIRIAHIITKMVLYVGNSYADSKKNTGTYSQIMLNTGSTPLPYEPYGYKLPLLSGSTPVDIYIGDDTISAEEYVDSGTGKIYRMVGGVLTPVDPPVPLPQIPTTASSTTISWAGQGLAPSEFDSIQEWVDIPTYKRVNGEWVEDNSN